MGTLTYSHTLVAGTTENINDVQDMFNDAKTVLNGNIDGYNAPNLLTQYRTLAEVNGHITDAKGIACYPIAAAAAADLIASGASGTTGLGMAVPIYAADHAVTGLTAKLRLRTLTHTNSTVPLASFTYGLHAITGVGGGADVGRVTVNGAAVAGSTAVCVAPGAGATTLALGADFSLPADGAYAVCVTNSDIIQPNAFVWFNILLQIRWV